MVEGAAKEGGAGKAAGEVCNLFNSFTPNTLVLLASGKKVRIDEVKVGDTVLAQDSKTGRQAAEPVERVIIGQGLKHLVTIAIPGERIMATDAHPFYVRRAHDFVTAGNLRAGEQLELSSGAWVTIASVRHQDQVLKVYNLSVSDLHTFFTGASSVLVHNCGPTLRPDVQLSGGRGGGGVKNLVGPENSVLKGSPGRIYQTDENGSVIADITATRTKPVIPGQGFLDKRSPTQQELDWLDKMWPGNG